jgi:ATP-dependent DNA helicase RecQ
LNLDAPLTLVTGFDRPNLYFEVQRLSGGREKTAALLQYLHSNPGKNGIVYCATRKAVEEVCDSLCVNGYGATRYHAGLADEERHANQDDFIYDRKSVMVATNAFGMGIDKSNVSFVIHYNMTKNIEGYYQEAGRAGRDGEAADCILYYNGQDVRTNQYLIEHNEGDDAIKAHNRELLKYMAFYSTSSDCLRSTILRYFGETAPVYCGHCSNCLTHFEALDISLAAKKIISCVYRVEQRGKEQGRPRYFGKTAIVDILHGSKNAKVMEAGFDTLSTYGLMADTPTARIRTILDYLIETGYLALSGTDYPVVARTEKSNAVLAKGFVLEMKLPKIEEVITARATVHEQEDAAVDQELLARLKTLRASLARTARVPAYVVFSNATLRDMCILKPRTRDDFLLVAGVGRRKLERYGADFLAEINRE